MTVLHRYLAAALSIRKGKANVGVFGNVVIAGGLGGRLPLQVKYYAAKILLDLYSVGYVDSMVHDTSLYADYYVKPSADIITFPEEKKNLIYIYLESFENTYSSYENGGNQATDFMPELIELAKDNTNVSNNDGLGGQSFFFKTSDYTMGSTVAQTSGIPLILYNSEQENTATYPSLVRLEDILHWEGYNQLFIRGEDAEFAGYEVYVGKYDNSYVFDYKEAKNRGWISDDYYQMWGYEDEKVFEFAKILIDEAAAKEEPFCATLYTADTHPLEGGYRCSLCDPAIKDDFQAAVRCTSKQVGDFINWLSGKDYYEDTVIIIVGDHLTPRKVGNFNYEENGYTRTTYNCIIHSQTESNTLNNRIFSALDMFPTTIAALGGKIEGERLGLGTNLYSGVSTLCEELGEDVFAKEVKRHSKYYKNLVAEDSIQE